MNVTTYQKLSKIQSELNCPKSLTNSFGNYKYRSCEIILEALKPLLDKYQAALIINDELVLIGDRYYIKATAQFINTENGETVENTAFAREDETKKGLDVSQITGACSSYARKYALNGLFLIDDTRDADTDEFAKMGQKNQDKLYCESCNAEITTEKAKSYYLDHPNVKVLCFNCNQKRKEYKNDISRN